MTQVSKKESTPRAEDGGVPECAATRGTMRGEGGHGWSAFMIFRFRGSEETRELIMAENFFEELKAKGGTGRS